MTRQDHKCTNFTAFTSRTASVCAWETEGGESEHNLNQSGDETPLTHLPKWEKKPQRLPRGSGLYSVLSSMSLPAKTASVPMMHTAMNTQSRMWSRTMATNFHSSAAWNTMRRESGKVTFKHLLLWMHIIGSTLMSWVILSLLSLIKSRLIYIWFCCFILLQADTQCLTLWWIING